MICEVALATALLAIWSHPADSADGEPLTGAAADRAWREPVSIVRDAAEVRETLHNLSVSQRVACWLDRRIDPGSRVSLQLQQTPLQFVLEELAGELDAACGRLGDTMLVGRAAEIDPLLTQAEWLANQLKSDRSVPAARRLELARSRTVTWSDLDRPVDILQRIATDWNLTIHNPEAVPHDLWAGGAAAGVDAAEALSLVLGQFELSFTWEAGGKSIRIVPQPQGGTVERSHRPKGLSLVEAEGAIQAGWPTAVVSRRGSNLLVAATALQHDGIARKLGEADLPAPGSPKPIPLDRRRFAGVKILRTPAADVLQALSMQGLPLKYDAAALAAAGVDLATLVTLEFEQATAEELIAAICDQAGMTYVIEAEQVVLRAKAAN